MKTPKKSAPPKAPPATPQPPVAPHEDITLVGATSEAMRQAVLADMKLRGETMAQIVSISATAVVYEG